MHVVYMFVSIDYYRQCFKPKGPPEGRILICRMLRKQVRHRIQIRSINPVKILVRCSVNHNLHRTSALLMFPLSQSNNIHANQCLQLGKLSKQAWILFCDLRSTRVLAKMTRDHVALFSSEEAITLGSSFRGTLSVTLKCTKRTVEYVVFIGSTFPLSVVQRA